ncbi:hypothetical protein AB0D65_06040 [Streptomyces griseoloalbus]|uniref:AraC family transcriptional regulator n=1 Tax=Streptomyces griseoloalbus TaxID=67303 RepID=A0ABV3E0D0_9ACTN
MPDFRETSGQDAEVTGSVAVVDTDDMAVSDRFGWWRDMVAQEVMPVSMRSPYAGCFRGTERLIGPSADLATFDFSPLSAQRSPAHIRRADSEDDFLILVRDSGIRLEQERGVACLGPGGMAVFSTSRPLNCELSDFAPDAAVVRRTAG